MSISALDINGFKSQSLLAGTHKAARFVCVVEPPSWAQNERKFDNVTLAFLCSAANIPAVNIQTTEEVHIPGVSLTSHMPYGVAMGPLSLKYYIDNNAMTYEFFSAWLRNVVNHGPVNTPYQKYGGYNAAAVAEVQYKSHYTTTIRLYALDMNNDALLEVVFYNAYPTNLGDVQFDWSTTDDISTFNVEFHYETFVPMVYDLVSRPGGRRGWMRETFRSRTVAGRLFGAVFTPDEMEEIIGSVTHTLTSSVVPGLAALAGGALGGGAASLRGLGQSIVSAAVGTASNAINTIKSLGNNIQNFKNSLKSQAVNAATNKLRKALRKFP